VLADYFSKRRTIKIAAGIPAAEGEIVMTEDLQTLTVPAVPEALTSANLAVAHCCDAFDRAKKAARARGKGQVFAHLAGIEAYRNAMPWLSGYDKIPDFIACTAHGMLIDVIDGERGARLLYAAQVALCSMRSQPAPQKPAA
jgi:hypothetical protein